jgi:hypothetical protein
MSVGLPVPLVQQVKNHHASSPLLEVMLRNA